MIKCNSQSKKKIAKTSNKNTAQAIQTMPEVK